MQKQDTQILKGRSPRDISNEVIIVTGSSGGIGKETAQVLASMNATVIVASRDRAKSEAAVQEIRQSTNNNKVEFMSLDLADLRSVRQFAIDFKQKYNRLDVLVNNAGVAAIPARTFTKDGFETQFGVNHIGHYYLTVLLLDLLKKSSPSRIVVVSSDASKKAKMNWDDLMSEKKYAPFPVYMQSKLANVLFTTKLQRLLEGTNVKAVALHPGVVMTDVTRYLETDTTMKILLKISYPFLKLFSKNVKDGAKTSLYCTLEDFDKLEGAAYYCDSKAKKPNAEALNEKNQDRLWEISEKLVKEKLGEQAFALDH